MRHDKHFEKVYEDNIAYEAAIEEIIMGENFRNTSHRGNTEKEILVSTFSYLFQGVNGAREVANRNSAIMLVHHIERFIHEKFDELNAKKVSDA